MQANRSPLQGSHASSVEERNLGFKQNIGIDYNKERNHAKRNWRPKKEGHDGRNSCGGCKCVHTIRNGMINS